MKSTAQVLQLSKVIGHRGACGHAPENTIASFQMAHDLGVHWVEFDVQLTADNKLVVFHDLDFTRLCGDRTVVAQADYADCSHLDVGVHFAPHYRGQSLPLLEDVLRYLLEVGITPNIELKPNARSAIDTAEALVGLLDHLWPHDRMPVLVSSFDRDSLNAVRGLDKAIALGFLCEDLPSDWEATLSMLDCYALHMDHHHITPDIIHAAHAAGYKCVVYTLNEPERAKTLAAWQVDAIITDYPDRILCAFADSTA